MLALVWVLMLVLVFRVNVSVGQSLDLLEFAKGMIPRVEVVMNSMNSATRVSSSMD